MAQYFLNLLRNQFFDKSHLGRQVALGELSEFMLREHPLDCGRGAKAKGRLGEEVSLDREESATADVDR